MKYVWVIMLVVILIIWTIYAIKDIAHCIKRYKGYPLNYIICSFEFSTYVLIFSILVSIFAYSLILYIKGY